MIYRELWDTLNNMRQGISLRKYAENSEKIKNARLYAFSNKTTIDQVTKCLKTNNLKKITSKKADKQIVPLALKMSVENAGQRQKQQ